MRQLLRSYRDAADYVAAMRRQQPEGPYYLLGFCFGGLVAYEMALQLHTAGQEVARLLLLDTHSPFEEAPPHVEDEKAGESRLAFHLRQLFEQGLPHLRAWAQARSAHEMDRWTQALHEWITWGYRLAGWDVPVRLHNTFTRKADAEASEQYHAKPYSGAITLLRGSETPPRRFLEHGAPDPLNG